MPQTSPFSSQPLEKVFAYGEQTLFKCSETGYLMALPEPSASQLNDYYSSHYFSNERYEIEGVASNSFDGPEWELWNHRFEVIRSCITGSAEELTVIDIGAGTGKFLELCSSKELRASAVEFSDKAREALSKRVPRLDRSFKNINDLHESGLKGDIVTMWAVLEHMYYSEELFSKITQSVKPGGVVAFSFPNPITLNRYLFGENWRYFIPIEHLNFFPPKLFKDLLEKHGFCIQDEKSTFSTIAALDGLNAFAMTKFLPIKAKKICAKIIGLINKMLFHGDTYEVVATKKNS